MEEDLCQRCDKQGINFQNIQTAYTSQHQKKTKQPNRKTGRRPKQIFLQRIHTYGQQTYEKMLNIKLLLEKCKSKPQ